jgi:hypothetical protein
MTTTAFPLTWRTRPQPSTEPTSPQGPGHRGRVGGPRRRGRTGAQWASRAMGGTGGTVQAAGPRGPAACAGAERSHDHRSLCSIDRSRALSCVIKRTRWCPSAWEAQPLGPPHERRRGGRCATRLARSPGGSARDCRLAPRMHAVPSTRDRPTGGGVSPSTPWCVDCTGQQQDDVLVAVERVVLGAVHMWWTQAAWKEKSSGAIWIRERVGRW